MHRGPEARAVARNPVEIHQLDLAHPPFEHRETRVDNALAFLGRLVLRVLAQIAVLAGALDFLRQIDFQLTLERGNFVGESLEDPILHNEIDFNIPVGEDDLLTAKRARTCLPRPRADAGPERTTAAPRRRPSSARSPRRFATV